MIRSNLPKNPVRSEDFIGRRAEINRLEDYLYQRKEGGVIQVIGEPGIGKTSLVQVVAQHAESSGAFRDGIIWIDCISLSSLSKIIQEIARVLEYSASISYNKQMGQSEVARYLEKQAVLLIFDSFGHVEFDDEITSFILNLSRHSRSTKIILISSTEIRVVRSGQRIELSGIEFKEWVSYLEESRSIGRLKQADFERYEKLYKISRGNPRALLLIKEQIDKGISLEHVVPGSFDAYGYNIDKTLEAYLGSSSRDVQVLLYALSIFEVPTNKTVLLWVADMQDNPSVDNLLTNLISSSLVVEINDKYALSHSLIHDEISRRVSTAELNQLETRMARVYAAIISSNGLQRIEDELPNVTKAFRLSVSRNLEFASVYVYEISGYFFSIDRPNEVINLVNTALPNIEVNRNESLFLALKYSRAVAYTRTARFDDAKVEYQNLLNLNAVHQDKNLRATILADLGGVYLQLNEQENAAKVTEQSIKIAQSIDEYQPTISVLLKIASIYESTNTSRAMELYEQGRNLAAKNGDKSSEAEILGREAKTHWRKNESQAALSIFQKQLQLFGELNNEVGQLNTSMDLGRLYFENQDNDLAQQYYTSALSLATRLGSQNHRSAILNRLAEIRSASDDFSAALRFAKEGVEIARSLGNATEIARGSVVVGDCLKQSHEYGDAFNHYRLALQIYSDEENAQAVLPLYLRLATLLEVLYQEQNAPEVLDAAIRSYQATQKLAEEIHQTDTRIIAQIRLGGLYAKAYRQTGEEKFYIDALSVFNSVEGSLEGTGFRQALLYENLGGAYYAHYEQTKENHDLAKAQEYLQTALDFAISQNDLTKWLEIVPHLSTVYFEQKRDVDWNRVWQFGSQSLRVASRSTDSPRMEIIASTLAESIRIAAKRGDRTPALQQLTEIFDYFQNSQLPIPNSLRITLNNLRNDVGEAKFALLYADVLGKLSKNIANLLEEARALMGNDQFEAAVQKLGETLTFLVDDNKEDFKRQKATILFLRGICLREQKLWEIALKDQEQAFDLFANVRDLAGQAHALLEIGFLHEFMNSYEDARLHYTDAYRLYKKIENKGGMANAVEHLGMLEFRVRMYPQAVENLEEARRLFIELGERDKADRLEIDLVDAKAGLQQK